MKYAYDIIDSFPDDAEVTLPTALHGAKNWKHYSFGGCALVGNWEIAERLCTPSELKKTHNGERRPNSREEWLDVQARALCQAWDIISEIIRRGAQV